MNKEENNKRGKYKISTRPISYTKELFLVLCLVGRELSPKTVKLFKVTVICLRIEALNTS